MKKLIIVPVVVAIAGLAWWQLRPAHAPTSTQEASVSNATQTTATSTAWIEVASATVNSVDEKGTTLGILASGDGVTAGMYIKTDATGEANVHFADGSSLRIDHNSTVKISEGTYDPKSGSLKVKASLVVGRVWSKIAALATPESHWQVRTGTAVATVRGTAFGMEASTTGDTQIVGSEHNVGISLLDPLTGAELTDATTTVGEHETLTIKAKDLGALVKLSSSDRHKKLGQILTKQKFSDRSPLKAWFNKNEDRDRALLPKIDNKPAAQTTDKTSKPAPTQEPKTEAKIVAVDVKLVSGALKITEGATLTFTATAKLSDGSTKDVTSSVTWQVAGSIGSMSKPGVLETKLGDDVSEIGTAFGAVVAHFKAADGELVAKSEIITVLGAVDAQSTQG